MTKAYRNTFPRRLVILSRSVGDAARKEAQEPQHEQDDDDEPERAAEAGATIAG